MGRGDPRTICPGRLICRASFKVVMRKRRMKTSFDSNWARPRPSVRQLASKNCQFQSDAAHCRPHVRVRRAGTSSRGKINDASCLNLVARKSADRPAPPQVPQDRTCVLDIDSTQLPHSHESAESDPCPVAHLRRLFARSHLIDGPPKDGKVRNDNPRSWPQAMGAGSDSRATLWHGKQKTGEAASTKHRPRNSTKPLPRRR